MLTATTDPAATSEPTQAASAPQSCRAMPSSTAPERKIGMTGTRPREKTAEIQTPAARSLRRVASHQNRRHGVSRGGVPVSETGSRGARRSVTRTR